MMSGPCITIVFDNDPGVPGLTSLWGFAALIEEGDRTILFDTGSNGRVLLRNMADLGLAPDAIDVVFLSHAHWDHIGGLDSVLELSPQATVVVHQGFSKHLIRDLQGLCGSVVVVGQEPVSLGLGAFSTGMLESDPAEQALVLETLGLSVVISGCAHAGIAQLVARATNLLERKIDWALGGFHLMDADASAIGRSISALQGLGVRDLVPIHCTGDLAKAACRDAFGPHCHAGGVGRRFAFADGRLAG